MKWKRWIAMLLVLLMLCGCAAPVAEYDPIPKETPFYEEEDLPGIGNIYITCDNPNLVGVLDWEALTEVKENYSEGTMRVEWADGDLEEEEIKIKVRGNSSAEVAKKSYTVKFEGKTDLMQMGKAKKWALLADPFDKSLMRIGLAFEYAEALGLPFVSQYRICKLWLNGEYRGIYIAMETIDEGKNRIDIDMENGDAILECDLNRVEEDVTYITAEPDMRFQINEPEEPTNRQEEKIENYLHKVYKAVASGDHTKYEKWIDVDSFVNYYIFHEVVKDVDFGEFSTRYFIRDGKLYAGPPWDMDLSMGNVSRFVDEPKYYRYHNIKGYGNGSEDSTEGLWVLGNYYEELLKDEYFCELVKARWQEVLPVTQNLFMENELGDSLMDRYLAAYGEDLLTNYSAEDAAWPIAVQEGTYADQSVASDYDGNVEELRMWLTDRVAWLDAELGTAEE